MVDITSQKSDQLIPMATPQLISTLGIFGAFLVAPEQMGPVEVEFNHGFIEELELGVGSFQGGTTLISNGIFGAISWLLTALKFCRTEENSAGC